MEPVLVDTSVWIDFFNKKQVPQVHQLDDLLLNDKRICICPTIIQEVLQGLNMGSYYNRILHNLMMQEILICEPVTAAVKAAELYNELRKKGVTVRKSNDCLIAFHAIHFNARLLERDRDFQLIAQHTSLQLL